jgi:hypothetical protein
MSCILKILKGCHPRDSSASLEAPRADRASRKKKAVHDAFVPRPSRISVRHCRPEVLPNDRDVWIEGRYTSSSTGELIPYYWSLRTGQYYRGDPPTGASRCIAWHEIQHQSTEVQMRVKKRVAPSKDTIRGMPIPRPNVEIVRNVLTGRKLEEKKDFTVATNQSFDEEQAAKEAAAKSLSDSP